MNTVFLEENHVTPESHRPREFPVRTHGNRVGVRGNPHKRVEVFGVAQFGGVNLVFFGITAPDSVTAFADKIHFGQFSADRYGRVLNNRVGDYTRYHNISVALVPDNMTSV